MKKLLLFVSSVLLAAVFSKASSVERSTIGDDDLSEPNPPPATKVDQAHAGYAARMATYERAARRVPIVEEPACPEGSVLWQRDSVTAVCAPLCTTDTDCIEGIERCAALSIPGVIEDEELVRERQALGADADADHVEGSRGQRDFVDDDVDAARRVSAGRALALCDPFFDFEGATDESLVELDDGRALVVDDVASNREPRRDADAKR
jgi:hypothetical protein